jgi:hypothetical protein
MRKKAPSRPRPGSYEVGKGRPPQQTRWKPGQSGNPRGRPRGAKNLMTIFHEELEQKYQIEERGKLRTMSGRELIVKRLVSQALKGDFKALTFLLTKEPEIARHVQPMEKIPSNASAEEAARIYARIVKRPF